MRNRGARFGGRPFGITAKMGKTAKSLLGLAAVIIFVWYADQIQCRVNFVEYDEQPEFVWAGGFVSAEACWQTWQYLQDNAPDLGADCRYAPRYRVWWLKLQNLYWQATR